MEIPTILVLAGRRSGALDPLAWKMQISHKCLVPVLGEAMIGRILRTLRTAAPMATILVSIEDAAVVAAEPTVARLQQEGLLRFVEAQFNLVDSVLHAAAQAEFPLLITTADNVLLTPQAIGAVLSHAGRSDGDAIVVMTSKEAIEAAHPVGKARYYEFRDGGFSNCNLFWLRNSSALAAAEAFRQGGQFLKVKGRLLKAFGLLNAIRFRLRWFTLAQMFRSISRRLKVRVEPLVLDDGRLAIDVDDEKSHRAVEQILSREQGKITET